MIFARTLLIVTVPCKTIPDEVQGVTWGAELCIKVKQREGRLFARRMGAKETA